MEFNIFYSYNIIVVQKERKNAAPSWGLIPGPKNARQNAKYQRST